MGAHLIDGEFQSDKYPTCPRGKVPLSVKDETAQDLLWEYARRRRSVDAEFSEDLRAALASHGYAQGGGNFEPLFVRQAEAEAEVAEAVLEAARREQELRRENVKLRTVLSEALAWGVTEVPQQFAEMTGEPIEDCEWQGEPSWFPVARALLEPTLPPDGESWATPRRYRSDDRDVTGLDNDLLVFHGNNGDWYVSVLPHGNRVGPAVRLTTSGTPRGFDGVPAAMAHLYRALETGADR